MTDNAIRNRLVEHGDALFNAPKQPIQFSKEPAADALLNDLDTHPHAFVLACVMDRQIRKQGDAGSKATYFKYRLTSGNSSELAKRLTAEVETPKRRATSAPE